MNYKFFDKHLNFLMSLRKIVRKFYHNVECVRNCFLHKDHIHTVIQHYLTYIVYNTTAVFPIVFIQNKVEALNQTYDAVAFSFVLSDGCGEFFLRWSYFITSLLTLTSLVNT